MAKEDLDLYLNHIGNGHFPKNNGFAKQFKLPDGKFGFVSSLSPLIERLENKGYEINSVSFTGFCIDANINVKAHEGELTMLDTQDVFESFYDDDGFIKKHIATHKEMCQFFETL